MYKYIKAILISIPILALFYLCNKQFPLNGKLEIVYDFKKPNGFIGKLNPSGRLDEIKKRDGEYLRTMRIDPVYFDLELPSNYQKATIQITYQSTNQPIIEIGALASKDIWNFQTKPIQNLLIDNLIGKWHTLQQMDTILLQREKKYDSIDSFIKNLPPRDKIAVFNYNLPDEYVYQNYQKSDEYLEIQQKLKGQHSFYTYLEKGENIDFIFWLEDINGHNGKDDGKIEIHRGSALVEQQIIPDDNIIDESRIKNDLGEFKISLPNMASGLYKINLLLTDDILISRIKTKQSLIAFINKLNLYNDKSLDKPVNIFSNSSLIKVATNCASGLQNVKVDNQELEIKELNIEYIKEIKNYQSGYDIETLKGNILISGDGLFGFSVKPFFDPRIKVFDKRDNLDGTDYIIANYHPPQSVEGWTVGEAIFDLSGIYKENNKIKIMISAPNLHINKGEVTIKEIKALLETKPFLEKVYNRLLKYLK